MNESDKILRLCHHEAAHAVAALALGAEAVIVRLWREAGFVEGSTSFPGKLEPLPRAIIAASGSIAERKFDGDESAEPTHSDQELIDALPSDSERKKAYDAAAEIVSSKWSAIEEIAKILRDEFRETNELEKVFTHERGH